MQNDIATKITNLVSRRDPPLTESEVSHVMTLCRKFLDHQPREERVTYPTSRLFCDWALHITLDRSLGGLEIVKRLNDTLVAVASANTDTVARRLTEVLSFRQLRREIGLLFDSIGISTPIHQDDGRWKNFAVHLIEIIRDCPLTVGEVEDMSRRARLLYETIKVNPLKDGCWVVGVAVIDVDYSQFVKTGKNEICLQILTSDTTRIVVPMTAQEVFGPAT